MGEEPGSRRHFTGAEKCEAVKRHALAGESVSSICARLGIAPNLFYRWQKELFDHGSAAFEVKGRVGRPDVRTDRLERELDRARAQLAHKDGVIAEITEDYVRLKKTLGQG